MARKTNKAQVLELAAQLGVEVGFDTRPGGPRGIARFTDLAPNPYK